MKHPFILCTMLFLGAASCSTSLDESQLSAQHQRNGDLTVLSAQTDRNICFLHSGGPQQCSGYSVIHPHESCTELSKRTNGDYTFYDFDCTAAGAAMLGNPVVNRLLVSGAQRGDGAIDYRSYYWAQKIRVVIKESVLNAESFQGVGFFNSTVSYHMGSPAPGPRDNNDGQFASKADLKLEEAVTLKDGSAGRVASFHTFVRMSDGGSSYIYANYIRPFAKFFADGEEFFNWDEVQSDYLINWRYRFDRSADVLR